MSTEIKKKGKTAGYSNEVRKAKHAARRAEAEERWENWTAFNAEEQLHSLSKRRGKSARQVAKIKSRI